MTVVQGLFLVTNSAMNLLSSQTGWGIQRKFRFGRQGGELEGDGDLEGGRFDDTRQ
jgi:hypothetical protein